MRGGIGFWGGASYLGGNAKIYDGSFDYDTISSWAQIERTQAWSFNFNIKFDGVTTPQWLFGQQNLSTARGININISNSLVTVIIRNSNANRLECTFSIGATFAGYKSIIITYDGSSTAAGLNCYVNNVLLAKTIVVNTLSATIVSGATSTAIMFVRGTNDLQQRLSGLAKQYELISRVATASEIAATYATGSFQGAGVALADYLLAVDFDKTGTVPPTTRAGTPSYTITSFGGAAYTPYL